MLLPSPSSVPASVSLCPVRLSVLPVIDLCFCMFCNISHNIRSAIDKSWCTLCRQFCPCVSISFPLPSPPSLPLSLAHPSPANVITQTGRRKGALISDWFDCSWIGHCYRVFTLSPSPASRFPPPVPVPLSMLTTTMANVTLIDMGSCSNWSEQSRQRAGGRGDWITRLICDALMTLCCGARPRLLFTCWWNSIWLDCVL